MCCETAAVKRPESDITEPEQKEPEKSRPRGKQKAGSGGVEIS